MKHEWRKKEKGIYLPKTQPELVDIPEYRFLTIAGKGNPNNEFFSNYITALYSVSYAIKMTLKKREPKPEGYTDYTVYPLEGVWAITDKAKKTYDGTLNKDDLVFTLMIRQPDFISEAFFQEMLNGTKTKKPQELLDKVKFEKIREGKCIQMLHIGPYDNEPESFQQMEAFVSTTQWQRESKVHREIYLSDFRKVAPEKLKTVLRFKVVLQ